VSELVPYGKGSQISAYSECKYEHVFSFFFGCPCFK